MELAPADHKDEERALSTEMDRFSLWQRTLADQRDGLDQQREILRQAFLAFRERAAQLVGEIGGLLPQLTVHDITHLDALWRVADEIAGPGYELNPAEAFVLGGAFLLHDAAHVLAAYDDGLEGIKQAIEWRDLIAQRFNGTEPAAGSPEERVALFQVLRHLHAKQARKLPKLTWKIPSTGERLHLLEHHDLRVYYGELIGEIAQSHHWPPSRVMETFEYRHVNTPPILAPATWSVDALKVAFLLRTADAAHIDGQRAPWFLFALRSPEGISQSHWHFQAKMGQPQRTERGELRLSSGALFGADEQQAWWLGYETACMIDRELRAAESFMRDANRATFAARSVEHISTPEAFATNVRTSGWEPVNVAPKVGNVAKLIANLGGEALYGDRPELALRELIQNAADAVRALRALGGIDRHEGKIEVALSQAGDLTWLHVTDTGVGMSRFVLTEVLLDFGNSLWRSESLLFEHSGLATKDFRAVGQFGIGFFSVFMLGNQVKVTTRRYKKADDDDADQWLLEFCSGLEGRPTLRRPGASEELLRSGTRVSVAINDDTLIRLLDPRDYNRRRYLRNEDYPWWILPLFESRGAESQDRLDRVVASLCPTLDIQVWTVVDDQPTASISPDDWTSLTPAALMSRLYLTGHFRGDERLSDLREESGLLVGRIGYTDRLVSRAIMTHGGIKSGEIAGIAGVVLGHNNVDLVRVSSTPLASPAAWARWAKEWVDSMEHPDLATLTTMHPLIPGWDPPVFLLNGVYVAAAALPTWFRSQTKILLADQPTYINTRDQVSEQQFVSHFRAQANVLFLPRTGSTIANALALPTISYTERVQVLLRSEWRTFKERRRDDCVGDVNGVTIIRSITEYTR